MSQRPSLPRRGCFALRDVGFDLLLQLGVLSAGVPEIAVRKNEHDALAFRVQPRKHRLGVAHPVKHEIGFAQIFEGFTLGRIGVERLTISFERFVQAVKLAKRKAKPRPSLIVP